MHGFYTEQRSLPESTHLSRDLAQHIFVRGVKGCVVVVTDRPQDLASTTKKQWHILTRQVQRERASTLRASRIAELSSQLTWMQRLAFTSKLPDELHDNSVVFATPHSLLPTPPICSTLYIVSELTDEQFHLITSWLPKESVVIIYSVKAIRS